MPRPELFAVSATVLLSVSSLFRVCHRHNQGMDWEIRLNKVLCMRNWENDSAWAAISTVI